MKQLNRGLSLNRGWCTCNIFHHQVNFLVNMESLQDNHGKREFECFYQSSNIMNSKLPSPFLKETSQFLGGHLIGVKTIVIIIANHHQDDAKVAAATL